MSRSSGAAWPAARWRPRSPAPASRSSSWSGSRPGGGGPAACSAPRSRSRRCGAWGSRSRDLDRVARPIPAMRLETAGRGGRPPDVRRGDRRTAGGRLRSLSARSGARGAGGRTPGPSIRRGMAVEARRAGRRAGPVLTTRGAAGTRARSGAASWSGRTARTRSSRGPQAWHGRPGSRNGSGSAITSPIPGRTGSHDARLRVFDGGYVGHRPGPRPAGEHRDRAGPVLA